MSNMSALMEDYQDRLSVLQDRILQLLERYPAGLTRQQLEDALTTSRSTVYENLEKLEKMGFVVRERIFHSPHGRPPLLWKMKTKEGQSNATW